MGKKTNIGKSALNGQPESPFSFKLKDKVVKTNHLDDFSVTSEKIAPLSIGTEHIQDKSITVDKIDTSGMDPFVAPERERAEEAERQLQSNIDDVAEDLSDEVQRSTEKDNQHDDYIRILDQNIQILDNKIDSTNNNLAAEIERSTNKDTEHDTRLTTLDGNISSEVTRAKAAEQLNANGIADINGKIPSGASSQNQLADKNFVNSSVATNTANYISDGGEPFNSFAELKAYTGQVTNNDYAFVRTTDAAGNTIYKRYKFTAAINAWALEYELNNSSFTSTQWDTINSGITLLLKNKLEALPTNDELIALLAQKQAVINDLQTIRSNAQAGATAYQKPSGGIPSTDMTSEVQNSLTKANTAVQPQSLDNYYTRPQTDALLNGKQDIISDLAAIRDGAAKGETAIQEHQSLADYYNKSQVDNKLAQKQDTLTIDHTPTINSNNPISSDAVYDLQQYTINGLNGKQAVLTFDNMPTAGSANPVTSGGIYTAIVNSSGVLFIEVDVLPAPSVSTVGAVYVLKEDEYTYEWYVTIYDQYATPPEYKWRKVNTNSIDLSEFYTRTECDYTFAKKSEMSVTPGTGTDIDKTTIQLKNGLTTTVLTQHQDISGKQDVLTFATDAECEAAAEELT